MLFLELLCVRHGRVRIAESGDLPLEVGVRLEKVVDAVAKDHAQLLKKEDRGNGMTKGIL
jgi:hypothetical protein